MNIKECKEGLSVRISFNIDATHNRHDSCGEMRNMRGKVYQIERFSEPRNYVIIRGYTWDPEDLMIYEEKDPEPQIFHFDEANL